MFDYKLMASIFVSTKQFLEISPLILGILNVVILVVVLYFS